MSAVIDSRKVTSTAANAADPPRAAMAAARSLPRSAERPATTTWAPACAMPVQSAPPQDAGTADHNRNLTVETEKLVEVFFRLQPSILGPPLSTPPRGRRRGSAMQMAQCHKPNGMPSQFKWPRPAA